MTQAIGMAPGMSKPGDVRRDPRFGYFQCHGDGQSAKRAIEFFMDVEPG